MRALTGGSLLEAWERGAPQGELDRALTMLAVACPQSTWEELAALSIAERNLRLLRLRRDTFGHSLSGYLPCSSCGARLEFALPLEPLIARVEGLQPGGSVEWTIESRTFALRPVNSKDLQAAMSEPDPGSARRLLVERCVSVSATEPGATGKDDDSTILDQEGPLLERFEELHHAAEIVCDLQCPECAAPERVDLDIARFLWSEVRHAAIRLLREVHELATAYGWPEEAIVTMSHRRRNLYLEMVRT